MMTRFQGVDHVDVRVTSLRRVQPFYDLFMPAIGLATKRNAYVDESGEWTDLPIGRAPNAVEYYEDAEPGRPARFIGIIEDAGMRPTRTRIAFAVVSGNDLDDWHGRLHEMGAQLIEWSVDPQTYPAIFFEDPCGTKLELCA